MLEQFVVGFQVQEIHREQAVVAVLQDESVPDKVKRNINYLWLLADYILITKAAHAFNILSLFCGDSLAIKFDKVWQHFYCVLSV